jgi:hypothetical protein
MRFKKRSDNSMKDEEATSEKKATSNSKSPNPFQPF